MPARLKTSQARDTQGHQAPAQGTVPPQPLAETTSPNNSSGVHPVLESFLQFIKNQHQLAGRALPAFDDDKSDWKQISSYQVEPAFFSYTQLKEQVPLHDPNIIREILDKTMRATHPQGDLVATVITKSCCELYETLDEAGQTTFLEILSREYSVSSPLATQAARHYIARSQDAATSPRERLDVERALRQALIPTYATFFQRASRIPGGLKFIIDLRKLLLKILAHPKPHNGNHSESNADLVALNHYLLERLQSWLVGVLDLQRITWNSPASTLEKLRDYEAVHAIADWPDLKKRVGPGRRCYGFFHRSMPYEPLVFVEVALVNDISDNVQRILHDPKPQLPSVGKAHCAIFYSISTQRGLAGVELGSFLIKRVVHELQLAYPSLKVFCTLSPIPGFRAWLETQWENQTSANSPLADPSVKAVVDQDRLRRLAVAMGNQPGPTWVDCFQKLLQVRDWSAHHDLCKTLRPILLTLCVRYLLHAKRGQQAHDPVANFHLRNGARVHRVNWLADTSAKGLDQSFGMMVNYNYLLDQVETNNYQYTRHGTIVFAPDDPWLAAGRSKL
ncbi:hypothetical protein H4R34_002583 [Dimargaris verticillata]|uniref:Malonyl-CoA decarboxylase n=1 Tax=Dimargaris verticillata TaxID=2761393 RepID=A0A9W8B3V7_9FUNG|nr:hypothetical protein H4R34_002583 [Dimargaris verticillata]